jgi:glycosidase
MAVVATHEGYLRDLGVTALYLNPVFQSASNHRYHTYDYFRVDPILGGNGALRRLVDACHLRGMGVVLDGVFNHCGRGFYPFHHVLECGAGSPYREWFDIHSFPLNAYTGNENPNYAAWWNLPELPKLDTRNPDVREYLLQVGEHWIRFGADGWRLDVPNEIDDDEFWREFRRRVRAANREAYIVGEIWDDASRWLQGDMFDGVMNYPAARLILGLVGGDSLAPLPHGPYRIAPIGVREFAAGIERLVAQDPAGWAASQLNLLGSHDTPRVSTMLAEDETSVRLAYALLFFLPGVPCIYYGDELGLTGGQDPECRGTIPWDRIVGDPGERYRFLATLSRIRRGKAALRCGGLEVRHYGSQCLRLKRRHAGECVVAWMNLGNEEALIPPTEGPMHWVPLVGSVNAADERAVLSARAFVYSCPVGASAS